MYKLIKYFSIDVNSLCKFITTYIYIKLSPYNREVSEFEYSLFQKNPSSKHSPVHGSGVEASPGHRDAVV